MQSRYPEPEIEDDFLEIIDEEIIEEVPVELEWNLSEEIFKLIDSNPDLAQEWIQLERRLSDSLSTSDEECAKSDSEQFYQLIEQSVNFRHDTRTLCQ